MPIQEIIWKGLIGAISIITTLLCFLLFYIFDGLNDVDSRLTTIEASRCTAAMCADIRSALSNLQTTSASLPQQQTANKVEIDRLSRELWEAKRTLSDIEKRLDAHGSSN